jgi:hypothetical protein
VARRLAKVAFARVASVRGTPMRLDEILRPGTAVERYGRIWRTGQWREQNGDIAGRIGYERPAEVAELWDDQRQDFVERHLVEGLTSPFVVDPRRGLVVFQLRAGRIKPQSFVGALKGLLDEADPQGEWTVDFLIRGEPLDEWEQRARRITNIEVRVERPNPHYAGRDEIEEFVEGHRAKVVKIILQAYEDDPQGLSIDEFVRQAIDQGLYKGRVKVGAEFDTEHGVERREWRSDVEGSPEQTEVSLDPQTGDASTEAMQEELEEYPEA